MMTDPIADMLARIRNAQLARHDRVEMPASRLKHDIARILRREGYVKGARLDRRGGKAVLRITLRYDEDNRPAIHEIRRVSRPGRRVYVGADEIPSVKNGLGIAILSTSRGVLTDREARKLRVGGELLCTVF